MKKIDRLGGGDVCTEIISKNIAPALYSQLCLSGKLWTYLVDLNEQAQNHLELVIDQMKAIDGITEDLKLHDQMAWVGMMNAIRNRAEELIIAEIVCK